MNSAQRLQAGDVVPVLHYVDFGGDPDTRLRVLRALGVLMEQPPGLYTAPKCHLLPNEWLPLRAWLLDKDVAGDALSFWRAEPHGVRILRSCPSHVLVGTAQLLHDLAISRPNNMIPPDNSNETFQPPSLDEIWHAARLYVSGELTK